MACHGSAPQRTLALLRICCPAGRGSEPEEDQPAGNQRGADEGPLAPSGHERAGEDADPLEEKHTARKEAEHSDDPNREPHR